LIHTLGLEAGDWTFEDTRAKTNHIGDRLTGFGSVLGSTQLIVDFLLKGSGCIRRESGVYVRSGTRFDIPVLVSPGELLRPNLSLGNLALF
jgi:hypothetical protein